MTLIDLFPLLTWSRLFGYGALFLAISFLVDFARQPTYPKHMPMLGHGRGWVWGAGRGVVTVRFETATTGPGRVLSLRADDPALRPFVRPTPAEDDAGPEPGIAVTDGAAGT